MPTIASDALGSALEHALRELAATASTDGGPLTSGPAADSILGYSILREIHRGGQGVVYQALQASTKRKVAVKVMKEGPFAGPADKARFEREVQILGQLKHPNIVAIYDSGVAGGNFYFVMDYISGQSLDEYMAGKEHGINETLALFAKICDAVNAAHLQGVIHRDLKPSNVRVDAEGEPHVLDFGLAKVATGRITDESVPNLMTVTGQFMGSLPWASPEQAEAMPSKIDVRTDVYSLGVMLYQMLTGRFPYSVVGNMRDVLDNILRAEPARPSTVRKQINDEVETIVLKCLSKERERRYQTAGELARDIRRYLVGEPIEAKRDSGWYVLRKNLQRHRAMVAAGVAIALIMTAAMIVSSLFWLQAERRLEQLQTANAETERQAAITRAVNEFLNDDLLASADPAERGRNVTVREVLDTAAATLATRFGDSPEVEFSIRNTLGRTYRELGEYELAAAQVQQALEIAGDSKAVSPEQVTDATILLARAYHELGRHAEAEAMLRHQLARLKETRALADPLSMETTVLLAVELQFQGRMSEAAAMLDLVIDAIERIPVGELPEQPVVEDAALLCVMNDRLPDAERLYRMSLQRSKVIRGEEHPRTLAAASSLALVLVRRHQLDEAELLLRKVIQSRRRLLGDEHPRTINSIDHLARLFEAGGRYADALEIQADCAESFKKVYGDDHPNTFAAKAALAGLYGKTNRPELAEPIFRDTLAHARRTLPDDSVTLLNIMNNYGIFLMEQKHDLTAAEPLFEHVLARRRASVGDVHDATLTAKQNLAALRLKQQRLDDAEPLLREVLAARTARDGRSHPSTATTMVSLGELLMRRGKTAEAEPLFRDAFASRRDAFGMDNNDTLWAYNSIGWTHWARGEREQAEPYYRETLDGFRRLLGPQHDHTLTTAQRLAQLCVESGKIDAAHTLYAEIAGEMRAKFGEDHAAIADVLIMCSTFQRDLGRDEESARDAREALRILRKNEVTDPARLSAALAALGVVLTDRLGQHAEAEKLLRECLALRTPTLPENHWLIANTRNALGSSIAGQQRFDEAESMILDSYEKMSSHPQASPARRREALCRVVRLYDAWEKSEKATEYRALLEATTQPTTRPAN